MRANDRSTGSRSVRLVIGGVVLAVLAGVGLAGCGSDSKSSDSSSSTTTTKGGGDEQVFTQTSGSLSVTSGETFVIALDSNPSTGFVWTVTQAPDAAVVALEDQTYVKSDSTAIGAPGTERFMFKAVAPGSTTIGLKYARPSDPNSPDNTNTTYTVTVQ